MRLASAARLEIAGQAQLVQAHPHRLLVRGRGAGQLPVAGAVDVDRDTVVAAGGGTVEEREHVEPARVVVVVTEAVALEVALHSRASSASSARVYVALAVGSESASRSARQPQYAAMRQS